ncbi:MAG TPA: LppX_LprAFG lipoprotein [Actinophytocola sp.]|uniref:LppX_LprAFG lipoprotein n=1 Tax=Actinophytocola sp. TaxID=1872138 RepID=UPI002DDD997A|nr:LppX_LprAFG lipoprotein [Actinophytocola sp.]HEV2780968.1 LppX_LprAFG lipoprotein [Actinophytocola sp.]
MRRFTLLASGVAIAAVVLSGCGDNQTPSQGGGGGGPDPQVGSLKLLVENVAKKSAEKSSAHMVIKAEAGQESFEGEGDMKLGADPAMQITMNLPGQGAMEMRLVDEVFYVKMPEELEPGKPWLRIDSTGSDPISQIFGQVVKQLKQNSDPAKMLQQFVDAGEITATKQEDLNGRPTTHYTVTVDVTKAASAAGAEDIIEQAKKAGLDKLPMDVWMDQEGLPARVAIAMTVKDPQSGQSTDVKVTADYSDWGKPVDVAAPAPDQVAEIPR